MHKFSKTARNMKSSLVLHKFLGEGLKQLESFEGNFIVSSDNARDWLAFREVDF